MTDISLNHARTIVDAALAAGEAHRFAPLCVAVLDGGGHLVALGRADGAASYRIDIAQAKAAGCVGMGMGGRAIAARAAKMPAFYAAIHALRPIMAVPGGVLILGADGAIIGAVGISGDTADNDESCALAGIAATPLIADAGAA